MEPQALCLRRARTVAVAQPPGPDAPRRPELRDLLEQIDVGIEEERQPRRERVDGQATLLPELDVGEPVGQREAEFLHGGRAGFADVVTGDAGSGDTAARWRRSTP
jgi:hypothetical protein